MRLPFTSNAGAVATPVETPQPTLVKMLLPRESERTFRGVAGMLASFGHLGTFSLELVGDRGGIRVMARCGGIGATSFRRAIGGHYPQAYIEEVSSEADPLRLREGERAWVRKLRVDGHEALPLMTFDEDTRMPGADPILSILGAMTSLGDGERVVARLVLTGKEHSWAERYRPAAMSGAGSFNQMAYDAARAREAPSTSNSSGAPIILLPVAVAAMIGVNIYTAYTAGDMVKVFMVGGGAIAAALIGGYVYMRFLRPKKDVYLDPDAVSRRVSGAVFDAHVDLHAFQGPGGGGSRALGLLDDMAGAYSHYDNPLGSRFVAEDSVEMDGESLISYVRDGGSPSVPTGLSAFKMLMPGDGGSPSIMGSLEAASLWHPPSSEDDVHSMERMTSRSLSPTYQNSEGGAFVGTTRHDEPVHLPPEALSSHQFYVARTRMGKSTMMRHIVEHKMQQKAAGLDGDAMVVIDPHSDLVHGLMELCPPEIAHLVKVVDLGDMERVVGVNLLDPYVFEDRDLTCDGIVRVAKGLWDNWGSRMQNILEHLVKSLHEANALGGWPRSEQYTILDGHDMLGIGEASVKARKRMLDAVKDPYLSRWWNSEFRSWDNRMKVEACAPVQTRLAYYASDQRARRVLGQPESTLDIRETIQEGGILLVATAQAYLGRNVSSLLGACILNLVDAVIRNQGTRPESERRGCLVVVDEMQSIPGVDYEGMLSEVGKFGGSLVLATQSLTKLDELSPTMRDTILANIGCLCVFQVAGQDAVRLREEIGSDRVETFDIVSLPRHECYVKMSSLPGGVATLSMRVRPPSEGNAVALAQIKSGMSEYTEEVGAVDELLSRRVQMTMKAHLSNQIDVSDLDESRFGGEKGDEVSLAAGASPDAQRRGEWEADKLKREAEREAEELGGGEDGTTSNSSSNV